MATPHNNAVPGDIAKTVLMSGDPLRAQYVAEHWLKDPVRFNEVRGMYGFTGTYKGVELSVMGHGMGIPSIGIYSYELYHHFGVENIIRFGSAGGISDEVNLMDVILASGAGTDSRFGQQYGFPAGYVPSASFPLLDTAVQTARDLGIPFRVGNVYSADAFYRSDDGHARMKRAGILACEMEAAGLYVNAAEAGKQALTILTVSDHIYKQEEVSALQRQTGFTQMIELVLNTAIRL